MCVSLAAIILSVLVQITSALIVPQQPANCSVISDIFRLRNVSFEMPDEPVNGSGVCGEHVTCCSADMEATLQTTVAHDLHSLLYHSFHSVHGMLATTEQAIADDVRRVSSVSENMTLTIFSEVYKGMLSGVRKPLSDLYQSLSSYLKRGRTVPADLPTVVPTEDKTTLKGYIDDFFKKLFPLVYQVTVRSLDSNVSSITDDYADCLSQVVDEIRPFGQYPKLLSDEVSKSFETTKVLLQAINLGIEVLNTSDLIMSTMPENTDSCRVALLRLYYCPKCLGLPAKVKPCNGYCLNVMRGCLTQQRTNELDLPWSNFLAEVERLVRQIGDKSGNIPSIDTVLLSFSSAISDSIMYAALNGPELERKVKSKCGPPKLTSRTSSAEPFSAEDIVPSEKTPEDGPVAKQLHQFIQAIETTKARGFFANLAEALCSDDSFAETRDTAECWNGHRVGEYTKPLVRPGLDAQKYNPELKWTETTEDPSIRHLCDKLRHMRTVVLSNLHHDRPTPMPYSQMFDESGSGAYSDDRDDLEDGSGSGYGDNIDHPIDINDDVNLVETGKGGVKTTGSGFGLRASFLTVIIMLSTRCIL